MHPALPPPNLLRAQEVIITLNIIPPYSAYVYDYADLTGQAVITLTNTTTEVKQVRLEGALPMPRRIFSCAPSPGIGAFTDHCPAGGRWC
jgi:hypothetical protein